jgi:hypothetical protein
LAEFDRECSQGIRDLAQQPWVPPQQIVEHVKLQAGFHSLGDCREVVVSGETDNTSVYLIGGEDVILYTPLMDARHNTVLLETSPRLVLSQGRHICLVEKTREIASRLSLPRVVLVNLCAKDVFPTPRLALSVASLAGYLRRYQKADVHIVDMQVGPAVQDVIEIVDDIHPAIIGISISFGQTTLATSLLERVFSDSGIMGHHPLVVAGNVVSAFAYRQLAEVFPCLVVCTGEGELTISGLVDCVKGRVTLEQVPGISYWKNGAWHSTSTSEVDMDDLPLPAMDTAEAIIANGGAMTMETSRGCFHSACSFCPRTHKPRKWKGMSASNVLCQLHHYGHVFDHFGAERRIFMADEEYFGWTETHDESERIDSIARGMIQGNLNLHYDTNTRIDQIYSPSRSESWHADRMRMLVLCRQSGLDRLLVGVESGSDSVLRRFNKRITSDDSLQALRILSACGIGVRVSFITFDPLMSFSELQENVRFLARRDAYLRPLPEISHSELFDGIHREEFVHANSRNTPLYERVAYMLVSLEALMNSDYIGLLRDAETQIGKRLLLSQDDPDISMARYKTAYVDDTIGDIAASCQRWVDRHFALDYCLRGMYKVATNSERSMISGFRTGYRRISYCLLKSLVWIFGDERKEEEATDNDNVVSMDELVRFRRRVGADDRIEIMTDALSLFDEKMRLSVDGIEEALNAASINDKNNNLRRTIEKWRIRDDWMLINP